MNYLPNIISVNSRYQHLSFVIVHENPANHGELQRLAKINSTVTNANVSVTDTAIFTKIKLKTGLEFEENFTALQVFLPSGRHFCRSRDTLFSHIRKILPYLDRNLRAQTFIFPLSPAVCLKVRLEFISNWRHGLLWRTGMRKKIGRNSSKTIASFQSIQTEESHHRKQSLMFLSVCCLSQ